MAYFCRFMCGSLSEPIWILTPFCLLNCSMGGVKVFLFLKFERFRAEGETHVLSNVFHQFRYCAWKSGLNISAANACFLPS